MGASEWLGNKESLLSYIETVHSGVKGLITDQNGNPVPEAKVSVQGIRKNIRGTVRGEYWRLLTPGSYTVTVSAPNCQPSQQVVEVRGGRPPKPTIANFRLAC